MRRQENNNQARMVWLVNLFGTSAKRLSSSEGSGHPSAGVWRQELNLGWAPGPSRPDVVQNIHSLEDGFGCMYRGCVTELLVSLLNRAPLVRQRGRPQPRCLGILPAKATMVCDGIVECIGESSPEDGIFRPHASQQS